MTQKDDPPPSKVLKGEETGTLVEHVDLTNQLSKENTTEPEMLLPHERDQTSGPTGTDSPGDEHSREVIKQAHDDTKQGLKDTDRRGIPSDIVKSDIPGGEDISGAQENDTEDKP